MRDALEYARQAYTIDPMYPWAASWYAVTLEFSGQAEECLRCCGGGSCERTGRITS